MAKVQVILFGAVLRCMLAVCCNILEVGIILFCSMPSPEYWKKRAKRGGKKRRKRGAKWPDVYAY